MTRAAFITRFGELYEHSPWVVEAAADRRPFQDVDHMFAELNACVQEAPTDARMQLLLSHPELAGKAAIDRSLTRASTEEQASAGLDRMTQEEFELFNQRNEAYRARFGFPFIICVRATDKAGIIAAMSDRMENSVDEEFQTALGEVSKIVGFRLHDIVSESSVG